MTLNSDYLVSIRKLPISVKQASCLQHKIKA